jgi:alkanesulfonate monooxygenase SsuD/methylene tetrahydromethanopterin reductase-like flavin-dependent oxidoreductase (luciferase family)
MRLGLALPQYDYAVAGQPRLAWATVAEYASRAERLGFSSLWLADHLFLSLEKYGGSGDPSAGFEPMTTLGALAAATTEVRLGTLVVCSQLRPPAVLAKQLAAADLLSGGRVIAGLGAGWFEPEFEDAGVPFERPGVRIEELAATIRGVRSVWGDEPGSAPCLPPPVQAGGPPVWVGGKGDRLLDTVARLADGWNTVWTWTIDDYQERSTFLDRACEQHGRDPAAVARSVGLYTLVGENPSDLRRRYEHLMNHVPTGVLDGITLESWRHGHLVGTVDEVAEQVAAWAEIGVGDLIVGLGGVPFQATSLDDLELIASITH